MALAFSLIAVALGGAALVMSVADRGSGGSGAAGAPCESSSWKALPASAAIGTDWTVNAPGLSPLGLMYELDGPLAADGSGSEVVYVSVWCLPSSAHDFIVQAKAAATATGSAEVDFAAVGDEVSAMENADTQALTVFIRRGTLVATLEVPAPIDTTELEQLARAQDAAMGGPPAPSPAPVPSPASPGPSDSLSPDASPGEGLTHVAPDLEALLPTSIGGAALERYSSTGDQILNPSSTFVTGLPKLGKQATDLQVAEAYDPNTLIFDVLALRIPGVKGDALGAAVLGSDMVPSPSDNTKSQVTVGGITVTKFDPGDGSGFTYAFVKGDVVYLVSTTDESLLTTFINGLK